MAVFQVREINKVSAEKRRGEKNNKLIVVAPLSLPFTPASPSLTSLAAPPSRDRGAAGRVYGEEAGGGF